MCIYKKCVTRPTTATLPESITVTGKANDRKRKKERERKFKMEKGESEI